MEVSSWDLMNSRSLEPLGMELEKVLIKVSDVKQDSPLTHNINSNKN